uniref:Protein mesh n=1 Tax=Cacopsylla melanoneura TaxID=428564 RepID=A0A8D9EU45_9HEMI
MKKIAFINHSGLFLLSVIVTINTANCLLDTNKNSLATSNENVLLTNKVLDTSNEELGVEIENTFHQNEVARVTHNDNPLLVDHECNIFESSNQLLSNVSRRIRLKRQIYVPPYQNNQNGYGRQNYQNPPAQSYQPNQISFVNPTYRQNNYQGPTGNRYAPPTFRSGGQFDDYYIISEARLREVRSDFLYWFFDRGGDDNWGDYQKDIHSSTPQIHKNFNFQLPFFGFRFNYTRVSRHGYLEFSDPPEHFTYPLSFPNKDWPKKNDPAFIGIFYSKCRIGSVRTTDVDQRTPGVYFRLERDLQSRTDQFGVEMRERLKWDIREGVVGAETFSPKHSVIITWKNVSFSGGIDNSLYKTNTFQLVLATDEVYSYAIFNYAEIQWTSHTEAGGDTSGGEGGVPAFVGFNAGNGTRSYEYYPYSQRSTIRDLVGRGWANGFPGRHIFRIDENIMLGTCNKDIAGANLPLVFAPESGNMLGGTVVNITGPCFEPGMKIRCKFDIVDVVGTVVDRNRAICVQPFLMAEGYVIFDIKIGEGQYNWKGKYFVETPATATERIYFETDAVHERYPQEIKITWDKYNLTSNLNTPISVSLYGYRETTITPELVYIDMLEEGVANSGSYTIAPAAYRQRYNWDMHDIRFGFIHINLTNPVTYAGLTVSPVLWSKPIPLGWYFAPQWQRQFDSSKWEEYLCDDWIKNDRYLKNFASDISQCPCTLEQALADKGRFLPDFDCDLDLNPNCFYNKGARHCVRTGAPSLIGSEQQCCYDKNDYLMLSYDQQWGSRPRRSHNLGYLPWTEANKVPTLSQWFHDVSPFYMCCLWQHEQAVGCETFRFERRPSQDCVAYQAPSVATIFGDPHFITFDDLEFTFNGKGEFVLVHADTESQKFDVQARFEQVSPNIYGPVRATQLTSIVARDNTSAIIEVRLRPPQAQWRYRLDVFANGKRIFFDRSSLKTQHFHGVTVYTPSSVLNQSEVIMMFQSGAGVEVVENKGYMTARVFLPWTFINQTRGLLGNWSFDASDDFALPDGTVINPNINNFERVHKDFGLRWLLEDREERDKGASLFLHEYGRTASYFANRTFLPVWDQFPEDIIPANRSKEIRQAYDICGDSYQCRYDYAMSLNRDMAFYTLKYQQGFTSLKEQTSRRVISCGILETPRFGRKSNFLFVPGTKVTFECNQDFVLTGDQRRTCNADGQWDIPEYGYTECLRHVEYESRTAYSSLGLTLIILVPLLLLLCCIGHRLYHRMRLNKPLTHISAQTLRRRKSVQSLASVDDQLMLSKSQTLTDPVTPIEYSPSEILYNDDKRKFRFYERSYKTNEPLPDKPDIDWGDIDVVNAEEYPALQSSKPGEDTQYRELTGSSGNAADEYRLPSYLVNVAEDSEFSSPVSSSTGRDNSSSKRIQTNIF